jgi:hypothetical protein
MRKILQGVATLLSGNIGDDPHSLGMSGTAVEHSQAPATILNLVGDDWHCWRLPREPDREFSFRLALHLQILAIEDDLERVLAIEKQRSESQ